MPTNEKEYMRIYFKNYVKNSDPLICHDCLGLYRRYNKHIHIKTKKHIKAIKKKKN